MISRIDRSLEGRKVDSGSRGVSGYHDDSRGNNGTVFSTVKRCRGYPSVYVTTSSNNLP